MRVVEIANHFSQRITREHGICIREKNNLSLCQGYHFIQAGALSEPFKGMQDDARITNGGHDNIGVISGAVRADDDFETIRGIVKFSALRILAFITASSL